MTQKAAPNIATNSQGFLLTLPAELVGVGIAALDAGRLDGGVVKGILVVEAPAGGVVSTLPDPSTPPSGIAVILFCQLLKLNHSRVIGHPPHKHAQSPMLASVAGREKQVMFPSYSQMDAAL